MALLERACEWEASLRPVLGDRGRRSRRECDAHAGEVRGHVPPVAGRCRRGAALDNSAMSESHVRSVAIVCQVRSRSRRPSATARNSGSVKVVKPAYTLLIC